MEYSKIEELARLQKEMQDKVDEILPIIRSYHLEIFQDASYFDGYEMHLEHTTDKDSNTTVLVVGARSFDCELTIPASYLSMTEEELRAELEEKKREQVEKERMWEERRLKEREETERKEYERLKAKFG